MTLQSMCFRDLCGESDDENPVAYRIHRLDSSEGYHDRRRSSVERHINNAPAPIPLPKGKRYPKVHKNKEKHYKSNSTLYEYPTLDFPYATQNYKGTGRRISPGGSVTYVDQGYTRTITDSRKTVLGLSFHPLNSTSDFLRAQEIYPAKSKSKSRSKRRRSR